MEQSGLFRRLALALAMGLLIGTEHSWHGRVGEERTLVAGVRTLGLMSQLGRLWATVAVEFTGETVDGDGVPLSLLLMLGIVFAAFAGGVADAVSLRKSGLRAVIGA